MTTFAQRFVTLRDQLERHLPSDAVRLLLYFDRAASMHGLPRDWDVFPEAHLSDCLGVRPEAQTSILDLLVRRGLIEVGELHGQRAIRVVEANMLALIA